MKKILLYLVVCLLCLHLMPVTPQEKKQNVQKKTQSEVSKKKKYPPYRAAGKRDPFRNLLVVREIQKKSMLKGITQISIDDLVLIGIVKTKDKHSAIVDAAQGFPFYVKEGDQLADGFVLTIKDTHVIFRKTKDRGLPLRRPKDIKKEIYPEER